MVLSDSAGAAFRPRVENAQVVAPLQAPGDVNRDGVVNIQDLVLVAGQFGQAGQNDADVNGDGVVNIQDLVLVAGALGNAAAAPSGRDLEIALTRADVRQWLTQAQGFRPGGCGITTRYSRFRTLFSNVETKKDNTLAKLPESVQPGDLDTVPPRQPCRCATHDL